MLARLQVGGRKGGGLRGRGRDGLQAGRAGPPPRRLLKPEGTQGESLTDRHLALLPTPAGLRPQKAPPLCVTRTTPRPRSDHQAANGGGEEREMQTGCRGVLTGDIS